VTILVFAASFIVGGRQVSVGVENSSQPSLNRSHLSWWQTVTPSLILLDRIVHC